jgi:hypothetical protein
MSENMIEVFDQLLELYELRAEAESREDTRALQVIEQEVKILEATKESMRACETASVH